MNRSKIRIGLWWNITKRFRNCQGSCSMFFLTQRVARSKCNLWAEYVESLLMMNVTINHVCLLQFGTPQLWAIDAGTGHSSQAYPWGYTNYEFSVGATSHPAWKPWARWWFQIHCFYLFFLFHFSQSFFPIFSCRPRMIPIDPSFWNGGSALPRPATVCSEPVDRGPWCGAMSGHEGCHRKVGWSGKEFWTCAIWEFGRFPISEFPQPQQPSVEAELATAITEVRRGFSHRNLTVQKSTAARSLIALETWFWWVIST